MTSNRFRLLPWFSGLHKVERASGLRAAVTHDFESREPTFLSTFISLGSWRRSMVKAMKTSRGEREKLGLAPDWAAFLMLRKYLDTAIV